MKGRWLIWPLQAALPPANRAPKRVTDIVSRGEAFPKRENISHFSGFRIASHFSGFRIAFFATNLVASRSRIEWIAQVP
jgi:hypothetical protein